MSISIALKILILSEMNATWHDESFLQKKTKSERRMKETDWRLLEHVSENRVSEGEKKKHPIIKTAWWESVFVRCEH